MKKNIKILIVDDDPMQVQLIDELLKNEGHETFSACSACETLEALKSKNIDIVLLDVNLGSDNAAELLNIVKPKGKINNPFVLLISGYEYDNKFIGRLIKEGADGF
ncbi:MAG TPA: response regulator, partial [Ignavibacteria bacterium]